MSDVVREVRCEKCNKLLYKTCEINNGELQFDKGVYLKSCEYTREKIISIECKCPRCGEVNTTK